MGYTMSRQTKTKEKELIKGVFVALGIMVVSALIPIVHFIAVPVSPFIGGYFGVSFDKSESDSYAVKGLKFGSLLGLMVLLVSGIAAAAVMFGVEPSQRVLVIMWIGVGVFTLYTGSMSALGAMYSVLRANRQPQSAL
jgi:hypothetical protein